MGRSMSNSPDEQPDGVPNPEPDENADTDPSPQEKSTPNPEPGEDGSKPGPHNTR
jgi:hypothetical protein